jgi:hypothetical protein
LKHQYQTNVNVLIGILKDDFLHALLEKNPRRRTRNCKKIIMWMAQYNIPISPGRHVDRKPPRQGQPFPMNRKSSL